MEITYIITILPYTIHKAKALAPLYSHNIMYIKIQMCLFTVSYFLFCGILWTSQLSPLVLELSPLVRIQHFFQKLMSPNLDYKVPITAGWRGIAKNHKFAHHLYTGLVARLPTLITYSTTILSCFGTCSYRQKENAFWEIIENAGAPILYTLQCIAVHYSGELPWEAREKSVRSPW